MKEYSFIILNNEINRVKYIRPLKSLNKLTPKNSTIL